MWSNGLPDLSLLAPAEHRGFDRWHGGDHIRHFDFVAEVDHAANFVVGHASQQTMRTACREAGVRQARANLFRRPAVKAREFNIL